MSNRLGVFRSSIDPSTGAGLVAAIGQLAVNVVTNTDYVKTGSSDTAWSLASTVFGGLFHGVALQAFTAAGANTYTPTAGMKYCLVISTGGGGGGGGADTDGAAGTVGLGSGGAAGGTCIEVFTAATIGASQTVTIGAAGTAGANTGGDGGAGGDTTFGALHTATGGSGGTGSATSANTFQTRTGGIGGAPAGGAVNIRGGDGGTAIGGSCDGTTDLTLGLSGFGGGSFWGGGARARASASNALDANLTSAGSDAVTYGAGGSGGVCLDTTTGVAGGAGAAGICVVIEFLGPA